MGGDGGTISSNRTYLRGAGKACHTADHPSNALKRTKIEDAANAQLVLSTCAVSGQVLDLSPAKRNKGSSVCADIIVACPYGKLYKREKVLEALLHRSQTGNGGGDNGNTTTTLGSHIRGMKDLHPVRFHVTTSTSTLQGGTKNNGNNCPQKYVAACPITGSEIGSGHVPSFVIVRTKLSKDEKKKVDGEDDEVAHNPNVLSESAIKEMGVQGLQAEYGPFEEVDMIRLAPPKTGGVFDDIQRKWEATMEEERVAKLKKKKEKKRKRGVDDKPKKSQSSPSVEPSKTKSNKSNHNTNNRGKGNPNTQLLTKSSAVNEARSTVQSAVAQNPVLSNLFGLDKKKKIQSVNERSIDLLTRNC